MQRILIVEDDAALAEGFCRALKNADVEVISCRSLREGRRLLQTQGQGQMPFALALLDVNLPDGNGFDFLREIKIKYDIRVIMLTVNDLETDIVTGLESGADDYITKPFSLAVLRARVASQLRQVKEQGKQSKDGAKKISGEIITGGYRFDFDKMLFFHEEEQVELSKTEQKLLRVLVENKGITVAREALFDAIWSQDGEFVDENALSVTVNRLRNKLQAQEVVQTVYGVGYVWAAEK